MKNATRTQIRAAFTKWMRRYQPDPDKFMSVRDLEKAGALIAAEIDRLLLLKQGSSRD